MRNVYVGFWTNDVRCRRIRFVFLQILFNSIYSKFRRYHRWHAVINSIKFFSSLNFSITLYSLFIFLFVYRLKCSTIHSWWRRFSSPLATLLSSTLILASQPFVSHYVSFALDLLASSLAYYSTVCAFN